MTVEKINEIIISRQKNYEKAHIIIDTDNKNTEKVMGEILECLKLM